MEDEIGAVVAGELCNADEGDLRCVVEVVDDDDPEALLEKLQHRVAADVAGAAGHKDGPHQSRNHLLLLLLLIPWIDDLGDQGRTRLADSSFLFPTKG